MRIPQWVSAPVRSAILAAVVLAASGTFVAAQAQGKIEATIFSYDGHDFVRTQTTLVTPDGKSAAGTKLDRDTPAFKALMQKRSYSGEATVFGKKYDANYAPLTGADGRLSGALFVAVEK